jgi:hypothetical protein
MPLGSSSAAPVTTPGPKARQIARAENRSLLTSRPPVANC